MCARVGIQAMWSESLHETGIPWLVLQDSNSYILPLVISNITDELLMTARTKLIQESPQGTFHSLWNRRCLSHLQMTDKHFQDIITPSHTLPDESLSSLFVPVYSNINWHLVPVEKTPFPATVLAIFSDTF